ncbi:MAG: hypothetical protein HKM93_07860 [Desulfobacteraceae bacterium]|nr:hypothetical protein [Desulfobacteraceae bacterium]
MIKFYTNRELAAFLDINLAKWKRWSREFLPPDPLGGLQSGYARQYSSKDAFKVFLGGYMVSEMKLAVAEARRILADLGSWLKDNGFYELRANGKTETVSDNNPVKEYTIRVCPVEGDPIKPPLFLYRIDGLMERTRIDHGGLSAVKYIFFETWLGYETDRKAVESNISDKRIPITRLKDHFLDKIGIKIM